MGVQLDQPTMNDTPAPQTSKTLESATLTIGSREIICPIHPILHFPPFQTSLVSNREIGLTGILNRTRPLSLPAHCAAWLRQTRLEAASLGDTSILFTPAATVTKHP